MLGNTFSYDIIRKYVFYMGSLFNDIYINRQAQPYQFASANQANTEDIETIKVPLSYGPKEKFLSRAIEDPLLNKPIAISLPRIAFELKDLEYDAERKLNKMNTISYRTPNSHIRQTIYEQVPYNFNFDVNIMVKNVEDGTKIIEQILPYFQPDWTAKLILIPEMNIIHDTPVILKNVSFVDTYEGDFKKPREIVWTLKFILKGMLYGPITTQPQIKQVYVNFRIPTGITIDASNTINSPIQEQIYVQPGLDTNGAPTSNISLTIPFDNINETDKWGFIIEYLDRDGD